MIVLIRTGCHNFVQLHIRQIVNHTDTDMRKVGTLGTREMRQKQTWGKFGVHKFLIWSIIPFTLYREDTLLASAFSHYHAAYTGFRNHLIAEVFQVLNQAFQMFC